MKTYKKTQKLTKNGVYADFIARLKALASTLPDPRTGQNTHYTLSDIVLGAFSVFFLQWPSLSVNRVETPAFQAGRFQHRIGGLNVRALLYSKHYLCRVVCGIPWSNERLWVIK